MKVFDGNWKSFVARTVVFGVVVFGAVRLAVARPGVVGGPARSSVTVAGTLTGVTGTAMARFRFYDARTGGNMLCESSVMVEGGAFSKEVPLEGTGTTGPRCLTMFDGADVFVEVAINDTPVGERSAVNPVPYAHFASIAGQVSVNNDCPAGYELFVDATAPSGAVVCRQRLAGWTLTSDPYDVVVRVGRGASAFWVDRYEATVTQDLNGAGRRFGEAEDWGESFPPNAQSRVGRFARSLRGVIPTRFISWFQASETCRDSGKRLPTADEWLRAAQLTPDPNVGVDGTRGDRRCNTAGPNVRRTGDATATGSADACVSRWGAEDMIGNAWEWTAEWYAGVGQDTTLDLSGARLVDGGVAPSLTARVDTIGFQSWPPGYGDDGTWNVNARVNRRSNDPASGVPAAAIRGGGYSTAPPSLSGVFALMLAIGPSHIDPAVGFRCVIPR